MAGGIYVDDCRWKDFSINFLLRSGAFLPPVSGMNFYRIPDPWGTGIFFGEIFSRILVL
jgi:hypothetical protein